MLVPRTDPPGLGPRVSRCWATTKNSSRVAHERLYSTRTGECHLHGGKNFGTEWVKPVRFDQ